MRAGTLRYLASFYAPASTLPRASGQRPKEYQPTPYARTGVSVEQTGSDETDVGGGKRSSRIYRLKGRTPIAVISEQDKVVLNDGTEMFIRSVVDDGAEFDIVCRTES